MKAVAIASLTYAAAVLQVTLAPELKFGMLQFHFLFLAGMIAVFAIEDGLALVAAATIGLLSDALSPGPLGPDMLALTLVAFIIRQTSSTRRSSSSLWRTWLVFVAVVPALVVSETIQTVVASRNVPWRLLVTTSAGLALGTALAYGLLHLAWRAAAGAGRTLLAVFGARRHAEWSTL